MPQLNKPHSLTSGTRLSDCSTRRKAAFGVLGIGRGRFARLASPYALVLRLRRCTFAPFCSTSRADFVLSSMFSFSRSRAILRASLHFSGATLGPSASLRRSPTSSTRCSMVNRACCFKRVEVIYSLPKPSDLLLGILHRFAITVEAAHHPCDVAC